MYVLETGSEPARRELARRFAPSGFVAEGPGRRPQSLFADGLGTLGGGDAPARVAAP